MHVLQLSNVWFSVLHEYVVELDREVLYEDAAHHLSIFVRQAPQVKEK